MLLLNIYFEKFEIGELSIGCSSSGDVLLNAVSHMSLGVSHLMGEGKLIGPWGLYMPGT